MIRKNEYITKLELENIRRMVLQKENDIEGNNNVWIKITTFFK